MVVKALDLKSLSELFELDPFVKNGFLSIDAIKMEIAVGKFQEIADPNSLAEYRLVLLEKPTPDAKELDAEDCRSRTSNTAKRSTMPAHALRRVAG